MPDINPSPEHAEVRYEKSDAHVGAIMAFGVALVVLGLTVHASASWLFSDLKEREMRKYEQSSSHWRATRPHFPDDLDRIPPPRLQKNETLDLNKLREAEESLLNQFGWVDRKTGIVRIPVAEAMKMLADPQSAASKSVRSRPLKEGKK